MGAESAWLQPQPHLLCHPDPGPPFLPHSCPSHPSPWSCLYRSPSPCAYPSPYQQAPLGSKLFLLRQEGLLGQSIPLPPCMPVISPQSWALSPCLLPAPAPWRQAYVIITLIARAYTYSDLPCTGHCQMTLLSCTRFVPSQPEGHLLCIPFHDRKKHILPKPGRKPI